MSRSPLVVGAHVIVRVNSQQYGRVADISFDSAVGRKKLRGLDRLTPFEILPTSADISFTLTIYRMHGDGGIQATGLAAAFNDITLEKYYAIEIIDRVTDAVLFRADRCVVESERWPIRRGYMMGIIQCTAISWSNETASKLGGST